MNLVKLFRKNNKKFMAIFVVIIMGLFIAGPVLRKLSQTSSGNPKEIVARYGDNLKITAHDIFTARQELEILKRLQADLMLRSKNLQMAILGEVLFAERSSSRQFNRYLQNFIKQKKLIVNEKQVSDVYKGDNPGLLWFLLDKESNQAGFVIPDENAGQTLGFITESIAANTYSNTITQIMKDYRVSEKDIQKTFGKMLAILEYCRSSCSTENLTTSQLMHNTSWALETIDVNYVRFDAEIFSNTQPEPSGQKIAEQFEKYKSWLENSLDVSNPYGFGYKLRDRLQLEYLAVDLDEIKKTVPIPSQQKLQSFYESHRNQFIEQILSDPNDPNSPKIEKTRPYAEVAVAISNAIVQEEINKKGETILKEALALTELGFEDVNQIDFQKFSSEQIKQLSRDYKTAAKQLIDKFETNIYTGTTGILSVVDMQSDEQIGTAIVTKYGYNPTPLIKIVFAVEELGTSNLSVFDVSKSRMFENISIIRVPAAKDMPRLMMIARIIRAEKAAPPENIEATFSKAGFNINGSDEDIFSVKQKVVEDLKKLSAMQTAKQKAEEFLTSAEQDGWKETSVKFNEDHKDNKDMPAPFELQELKNIRYLSDKKMSTTKFQNHGNPALEYLIGKIDIEKHLINKFFELIPENTDRPAHTPLIFRFDPEFAYYCVKDLTLNRIDQQQYGNSKAVVAFQLDSIVSESLSATHFNPENIIKRMRFKHLEKEQITISDVNDTNTAGDL